MLNILLIIILSVCVVGNTVGIVYGKSSSMKVMQLVSLVICTIAITLNLIQI